MKTGQILLLNEKEVMSVLDMQTVLDDVERALKEYAEGLCVNPVKLHLPLLPEIHGYLNSMPSYLKAHDVMGAKLVSVHNDNVKDHNLPVTIGTIVLHRPETGMPFAIMDGTFITSIRTGAAAGVGAKYLAKTGAHIVTLVGAGPQGYMSARAILASIPAVDELRIADLNPIALESLIARIHEEFPAVKLVPCSDYKEVISGSDIICMATSSLTPLLRGITMDKGTTVLLVGETVDNSDLKKYDRCIMDFAECFCVRLNEDLINISRNTGVFYERIVVETCDAELGDVITKKKVGRRNDDEIIVVGFVGMSVEDVMVAKTTYDRARGKGLGKVLDFVNG